MDLIISGGHIIDGTGAGPVRADLGIANGRIAAITPALKHDGAQVIDATGLTVTPGFIDIHSHSDYTLFVDPRAVSSVTQGVTTEVLGNCGHGCAPVFDQATAGVNIYGYDPERGLSWRTMAEYLAAMQDCSPAVNVTTLVANGNLRLAATGIAARPAGADELEYMKRLLTESLEHGGIGYSTGLEYTVERGSSESEVTELCKVAARAGGFYATHTRNLYGQARETIEEPIRAGREAGLPVQISHISVVARLAEDGRQAIEESLELVEAARRQGLDVTFDMHTRMFGTTNLSAILPAWALEGSLSEIEARLKSPSARSEMRRNPSIIFALARGDWRRLVIFDSVRQPEISRRSIADIAAERDRDPVDTVYDILLGEIDDLHSLMVIAHAYDPADLRSVFLHPLCMVGSDATALALDGPLAGRSFHGAFTWAAWFYHHFVTETGRLTAAEAIHRMTGLPASRLNWKDRGVLLHGAWADIAVFDAPAFAERGTTFEPNQTAIGMKHVLVNGVPTLKDGQLTGLRGGQVLRR